MGKIQEELFKLKSKTEVTIRNCRPEDAYLFEAFQQQCARETTHTLQRVGTSPDPKLLATDWEESLINSKKLRIGVFHEKQMIAQIGLSPDRDGHPWVEHIANFWMMVQKKYWGEGLGSKLMDMMLEYAWKSHYTRIEAYVRCENTRGMNLYLRKGFVVEGTRRHAALIEGRMQDEYYISVLR